jgi:hypothetical protein
MTRSGTATPIIGLVGYGVTGSRVGAHLVRHGMRTAAYDPMVSIASLGAVTVDDPLDLLVTDVVGLCQPHAHAELAAQFLAEGVDVVSMSADIADVRALLDLDDLARRHDASLIVGAAMSPGLSGLLAEHLVAQLYVAEELHVATHGTAGPACARRHHDELGDVGIGWHDGDWIERPGGSGRELNWFPEPIGARDCYRAAMADPLLLQRVFPTALRISARVSGTRRDRLTARLPMLTPPHAAGDIGAVRVEVRGADSDGGRVTLIAGASGPTGDLAAAVAAACIEACATGVVEPGVHLLGSSAVDPRRLLRRVVDLGVRLQEFTGVARPSAW